MNHFKNLMSNVYRKWMSDSFDPDDSLNETDLLDFVFINAQPTGDNYVIRNQDV